MGGQPREQGSPPRPNKKRREHNTLQHSGSSASVAANVAPLEPDMQENPDPDEAQRSTVEAAFSVFRQNCPDFTDDDLKASLAACWRIDLSVQSLIDEAFEHLVRRKFGEPEDPPSGAGPSGAPAEVPANVNNEDDAFESERAQMRAAMQQSEIEAAAYNASYQKPEEEWSCADYKEQFPDSKIMSEVEKEGLLQELCSKDVRTAALSLLRLEKKCCKWWRREAGVAGYFRELSAVAIEAYRGATQKPPPGTPNEPEARHTQCNTTSDAGHADQATLPSPAVPLAGKMAAVAGNPSVRRSKRIREGETKSGTTSQSLDAEAESRHGSSTTCPGRNVQSGPGGAPTNAVPNLQKVVADPAEGKCMAISECASSSNENAIAALAQVLETLTSRIEGEVLAACHDPNRGSEIVPSIFTKFRPMDWDTTETIDLLDE